MPDHVIIRNADLNAVDLIEVKEVGVFTQTRLGRAFKKVDAKGFLADVHVGDRLWVAQAGRGVIAECQIERNAYLICHSLVTVRTISDARLL